MFFLNSKKNVLIRPIIDDQLLATFTTKNQVRDIGKDIIINQLHQHHSSVQLLFSVSVNKTFIAKRICSKLQLSNFAFRSNARTITSKQPLYSKCVIIFSHFISVKRITKNDLIYQNENLYSEKYIKKKRNLNQAEPQKTNENFTK